MTRAEYARHRGVSRAAVTKAIKTGRILSTDGLIDPIAADREWARNTRPQAPPVAAAGRTPGIRVVAPGQHEALLTDAAYISAADPERVAIIEYDFETGQVLVVVFPDHVLERLYRRDDAARREFLRAELRRLTVDNRITAGCEANSGS